MISAVDALARLREGNDRFATGAPRRDDQANRLRLAELAEQQQPFAIIFGCSDSRVPAELVFDQGLGDLFVIRVAGNIVAPSLVGSVEFAATRFGTRLVVVLGHTRCGAVQATLEALQTPPEAESPNLLSIVERIRPAVEGLDSIEEAVRANVATTVGHLRHDSETLNQLIRSDGLLVVGAEYSLETGKVDFFDAG